MTNAVIYCRISKDPTGQAAGVQRQEADCRALCEGHGWDVSAVHVDNDLSAYSGKPRPGWVAVADAMKNGSVGVLVGWHPDRFTRQLRELEDLIDLVEATGVQVATVTAGEYDLSTPTGRMQARIVGAVARHESEHKSERLRRKHLELAEQGKRGGGGKRAFGYTADDKIEPREAKLIRNAAKRVLAGDGLRSIVRDWIEAGVPTVRGGTWDYTTLKRLLCSARISGQREHHGRIVAEASWPAIVTPADTTRLRAILRDPSRGSAPTARSYLLSGFVVCGRCGADTGTKMTARRADRTRRRYVCVTDRGGCGRCGIAAQPLEELVAEVVLARLPALDLAPRDDGEEGRLLAALDEKEAELAALTEQHAAGKLSLEVFAAASQRWDREIAERRSAVAAFTGRSVVTDIATVEAWESASFDRKRRVLAELVECVVIEPTTRAGNFFDPGRVSIRWLR